MNEQERVIDAYISRLKLLLNIAKIDGAIRTEKEIKEMIDDAKKYKTITPF